MPNYYVIFDTSFKILLPIRLFFYEILQESFYYGLSDEELVRVHDYNFDHPGTMLPLFFPAG